VEFALVGTVLMALLFGTIEIGRYLFTLEALRTAAAEAARVVTIRGSANMNARKSPCDGLDNGDLTGVPIRAPFLNAGTLSVKITGCTTNAGVTTVNMTVSHPFSFVMSYFGAGISSVSETAQAVFN
jgi:Flp pilus assembly protein TadG